MVTESGNVVVHRALRAPRVVIVFEADEQWTYWARLAVHACTRVWGGAGFVLIPHRDGNVEPVFLEVARSFDPDYVLTLTLPLEIYAQAYPGSVTGSQGQVLTEDELQVVAGDWSAIPKPVDKKAREAVAKACSPHRHRGDNATWDERFTDLPVAEPIMEPLTGMSSFPGERSSVCLSAPADWGGFLGVAAAAMCGAVDMPRIAAIEPDLEPEERTQLLRWLLGPDQRFGTPSSRLVHRAPGVFGSFDPSRLSASFNLASPGLNRVWRVDGRMRPGLIVVGDEAEDFAMAYAYERLYGGSVWLPASWWPTEGTSSVDGFSVIHSLRSHFNQLRRRGRELIVTSASTETNALHVVREALAVPAAHYGDDHESMVATLTVAINIGSVPWGRKGTCRWVIGDQYVEDFNAPVSRDDDGTITMDASCPPAFVQTTELTGWQELRWQVDLTFEDAPLAPGRGLDGNHLLASQDDDYRAWIRSGRDGVSYESERFDLRLNGAPTSTWLARPRLRIPSLTEWVDKIARQNGHSTALSPAGRRVEVIRRLWGSRRHLAADMAGPLRPVLTMFRSHTTKDAPEFAPPEGRVLATGKGDHPREVYLTYQGIKTLVDGIEDADLRNRLDSLLQTGPMRRGMILNCGTCGKDAFTVIDDLAQDNRCPRCGATSPLLHARWRGQGDEPCWYYDLHPIARELLSQDGDVPLLLANHLAANSRAYIDTAELEVRDSNGKQSVELDLIALSDGELIIAEAKRPDNLGKGTALTRSVEKLFAAAQLIGADQIITATAAPAWSPHTINALRTTAARHFEQHPLRTVRLVSGLGSPQIRDELLTY